MFAKQSQIDRHAILFDRESFWLIHGNNLGAVKVEIAKWVNKGSKKYFQNFVEKAKSPWISILAHACDMLNVEVVEGDSFLGRGAYGRVFKVKKDSEVVALKIVETEWTKNLHIEADALKNDCETELTSKAIGEVVDVPGGAALLLTPVGIPVSQPKTKIEVKEIFKLLWELHVKGLIHGDPRIPNVISYGEKLLWIDLTNTFRATPNLRFMDVVTLTTSLLRLSHERFLNNELLELIENYGDSFTMDNLDLVINKICEILGYL